MENFTAIYSTESIKDINYSFQAKDMASAIRYCNEKFSVQVKIVCDNIDKLYYESYSSLEELKSHLEVKEVQVNEENRVSIMAYISQNGNVAQWYNEPIFLELFGFSLLKIIGFIDESRTVNTKADAIFGARQELAKYFKLSEYEGGIVNEIPVGISQATSYLPAIQIIDEGISGINVTWMYRYEN